MLPQMDAHQYRAAAVDLIIARTGAPREWAEEVCDEATTRDWFWSWLQFPGSATPAQFVDVSLLDYGFASSGEYAGDDESAPEWLGRSPGSYR